MRGTIAEVSISKKRGKSFVTGNGVGWEAKIEPREPQKYPGVGNSGIDRKYTGTAPKRAQMKIGQKPTDRRR